MDPSRLETVNDWTNIYDELRACVEAHRSGHPRVPLRLVAAVQVIAKLMRHGYWGGEALNRAFLWLDGLPNGGMSADVAPHARDLALELVNRGLLKSKQSNASLKVALKRDCRKQLHEMLHLEIHDRSLQEWFARDARSISARELDRYVDSIDGNMAAE